MIQPPRRTILVAEDERLMAELLRQELSEHGYDVVLAASGPEAVRDARALKPDLILMDINMEGGSGLNALREIGASADGVARIPVLMLTGDPSQEHVQKAFFLGAAGFLSKQSLDIPKLLLRVDQALGKGRTP